MDCRAKQQLPTGNPLQFSYCKHAMWQQCSLSRKRLFNWPTIKLLFSRASGLVEQKWYSTPVLLFISYSKVHLASESSFFVNGFCFEFCFFNWSYSILCERCCMCLWTSWGFCYSSSFLRSLCTAAYPPLHQSCTQLHSPLNLLRVPSIPFFRT